MVTPMLALAERLVVVASVLLIPWLSTMAPIGILFWIVPVVMRVTFKVTVQLVPWAIDETLRWETPIVFVARQATRPTEIGGLEVPENAIISVIVGAGNRDDAHYADPDRFFSYRRATHKGEGDYGRQISLIALPEGSQGLRA